jgi:hypothetical protein
MEAGKDLESLCESFLDLGLQARKWLDDRRLGIPPYILHQSRVFQRLQPDPVPDPSEPIPTVDEAASSASEELDAGSIYLASVDHAAMM